MTLYRPAPEVPHRGLPNLFNNGDVADGPSGATLANRIYSQLSRRLQVYYSRAAPIGSSFTSGTTHRARFILISTNNEVWCTVTYSDSGVAGAAGFATLTVDGTSFLSSFQDPANSATAATGPGDFRSNTFRLTGITGPNIDLSWSVDANSAINSIIIFGMPVGESALGVDLFATEDYAVGAPMDGDSLESLTSQFWGYWAQESTRHFGWSGTAAQTGTTYENILDGTTTGYASTAAGFWTIPEKQATHTATTVPVTLWCYASSTSTGGRVRFTNSAGTIGTITGITGAGYYTTTATLSSTVTESQLVVVECSEATAGQTVTVNGAGMYSFTT